MLEPETHTRVHAKCQFTPGGNFSSMDVEIRVIWAGRALMRPSRLPFLGLWGFGKNLEEGINPSPRGLD